MFYGFWGMCFNDYRDTNPHEGYRILKRWRDSRFAKNKYSRLIQAAWKGNPEDEAPGAFFSITSNVDEHFKKVGFKPAEVREIHGHTEVWQCAEPCTQQTWRAPTGYRFNITEDLLAPSG